MNFNSIRVLDLVCPQCRGRDTLSITPAAFGRWKAGQALLRMRSVLTCETCDLYLEGLVAPGASWCFTYDEESADVVEPSVDP